MNILFVMKHRPNAGSTHALINYMRVGEDHGHTIALYGPPQPCLPEARFSMDVGSFDRIVYLFESDLYRVRRLDEVRLLAAIPRRHRFIFDADGMHNPALVLDGYDRNHLDEAQRATWIRFYDALSDRVLQPTLRAPLDPRVTALPFYGYNPDLVVDRADAPQKPFDVLHVGHNWWRWKEMATDILPAIARVRDRIGEIGFFGLWWDGPPAGAEEEGNALAYRVDPAPLRRLGIRTSTAVPCHDVIRTMSMGKVNILTQRPLLRHFRHLTLKYFEVFCADTIPLLMFDGDHAEAVYGKAARDLTLPGRVAEKILDALRRPDHYRAIVDEVRRHLAAHHAYHARVEDLCAALGG